MLLWGLAVALEAPILDAEPTLPVVVLLLAEGELESDLSSGGGGGLKFGGGGMKTFLCPPLELTDIFMLRCFGGTSGGRTLLSGSVVLEVVDDSGLCTALDFLRIGLGLTGGGSAASGSILVRSPRLEDKGFFVVGVDGT